MVIQHYTLKMVIISISWKFEMCQKQILAKQKLALKNLWEEKECWWLEKWLDYQEETETNGKKDKNKRVLLLLSLFSIRNFDRLLNIWRVNIFAIPFEVAWFFHSSGNFFRTFRILRNEIDRVNNGCLKTNKKKSVVFAIRIE